MPATPDLIRGCIQELGPVFVDPGLGRGDNCVKWETALVDVAMLMCEGGVGS